MRKKRTSIYTIMKKNTSTSKKSTKKTVSVYRYAKGLRMTEGQMKNPDDYTARVCVAYDKNQEAKPYTYVLIGNHDHSNEHDIRRIYAKTTGINYLDARIILYDTFIKRTNAAKALELEKKSSKRKKTAKKTTKKVAKK